MGKKQKQNKKREKRHNSKSIEKGKTQNFIASKEESDRNYKWKNLTPRHTHTQIATIQLRCWLIIMRGMVFIFPQTHLPLPPSFPCFVCCCAFGVVPSLFILFLIVVKSPFREGGSCCCGQAARKAAGTPKGLPRCWAMDRRRVCVYNFGLIFYPHGRFLLCTWLLIWLSLSLALFLSVFTACWCFHSIWKWIGWLASMSVRPLIGAARVNFCSPISSIPGRLWPPSSSSFRAQCGWVVQATSFPGWQ